ncbi:hypothetical protein K504DRAFT_253751 [Pleomassaria siparia CBS 279.74]|uniref:Uncharacterized protein n=1 Tax=Pleomassaria siparia CBS 279.74 TaxID=1314801 RepID=A0A6G1KCL0_9PLEO|nr:hypothetical protein K504DRAFT_253751 [Pleomassaria siparia CBS 279.74]
MPLHRRFTAKNALIVLLLWLFLALAFHLKDELWDAAPGTVDHITHQDPPTTTTAPNEPSKDVSPEDHMSHGNEPEGSILKGDKGGSGAGKSTAVVVATRGGLEDATWLEEYFPKWEKFIYRVDDKKAKFTVPKNKGRESMVYLT